MSADTPPHPHWTATASARGAFVRGAIEVPSTPAFVLLMTFIGFGALARESGLDLGQAVFTSVTIFALPGQVVLVDQIAQGATLLSAGFAVALTAVRLLPLTTSLMPHLRLSGRPLVVQAAAAHFVAITVWLESLRRLPKLPERLRLTYYLGFATALCSVCVTGSAVGHAIAAEVPAWLAAGLLFLTPSYFFLSLIAAAQSRGDFAALGLGAVAGPVLFVLLPGFDLVLTGLICGTLAYGWDRWRRGT